MITKDTGKAYATGMNACSQLGISAVGDQFTPQLIESLADKVKLSYASCGEEFTLLISEDGKVYSCGLNNVGQCGHRFDDQPAIATPKLISGVQEEQMESLV